MSMTNRLLYQQLKNIIRTLKEKELEQALKTYEQVSKTEFSKTCKMISYKCYEASIICKTKKANGYGRNELEATGNCIKNVFEFLIEDETNIVFIMEALKKNHNNSTNISIPNELEGPSYTGPIQKVGINHQIPTRTGQFENSIALNLSIHQNFDNSFDMKGDIEALSKNIGNISMINNSRHIDNHNTSHLEMDDILLKMMFDNAERTKIIKENKIPSQLVVQNALASSIGQHGSSFGPNFRKNEPLQSEQRALESRKILCENINLQNQEVHSYRRTQPFTEVTNSSLVNHPNKTNYYNKENAGHETRDLKGQSSIQPKSFNRSTSVEPERQKHVTQAAGMTNMRCNCSAAEELVQAKIRIEYLENRIKILEEENKGLKNSSIEGKEKDIIYKSTDTFTNMSVQFNNSLNKYLSEKTETRQALPFNSENTDVTCENFEKQPFEMIQNQNYKLNDAPFNEYAKKPRSQSVEPYSKRKAASYADVSGEQNNSRPEIKKMVPRLRIDMLPSSQLKNQKSNTNSLSNLNVKSSATLNSGKSVSNLSSRQPVSTTLSQNSTLMSQLTHILESGSQRTFKNK